MTFWLPGRWLGGTALIFGPLLLLTGVLLRIQFHFFFPQQLEAFRDNSALIKGAYGCFLAGNILLWPAVMTIARLIGLERPRWAMWGGGLVLFGLFARTFHAGVDHLAFELVRSQGLESATRAVASSYGAFHVVTSLNAPILFGWLVLAIGAYLSRVLPIYRAAALGLMAGMMMGVLKGSSAISVACVSGLCIAFVPLGFDVLREPPIPSARDFVLWFAFLVVFVSLLFYIGQLG
ncbi:MAG: hypothetical protein H7039_19110 [Bryobacteraceae bacterium]|nr:hypothetical protein [Bryobacteraceae bacterium]